MEPTEISLLNYLDGIADDLTTYAHALQEQADAAHARVSELRERIAPQDRDATK